jgi:hypothetical protein
MRDTDKIFNQRDDRYIFVTSDDTPGVLWGERYDQASPLEPANMHNTDKIVDNESDTDPIFGGSKSHRGLCKDTRDKIPPSELDTQPQAITTKPPQEEVTKQASAEMDGANLPRNDRKPYNYGGRFAIALLIAACAVVLGLQFSPTPSYVPSASAADPIVAIVGATGAGKSSLIKLLGGFDKRGDKPEVGHNLASCTFFLSLTMSFD